MWLNKEKSLLDKIAEVQDPLDAEIKKFEDEVERKENEEKQKREEAFIARQSSLLKYGAEYKNGSYDLGEISYETELIKQADSEMWDEVILPKYKRVYEQKEAARVEEETKRREQMEQQEKERRELEERQQAFRKEQEEFERQKLEMQRQKEESERIIREAEINKQQEELRKKVALRNGRVAELKNLGCYYDAGDEMYYFQNLEIISGAEIESLSEKEWAELVTKKKPLIEKIKVEAEEKRLTQIAKEKKEVEELAAQKERERIAEEQRLNELKKAEEMAQANDKTRYDDVIRYLSGCPIYEMKSSIYKKRMNIIKDFITDLKEN
jgi:myosin heavy subunit